MTALAPKIACIVIASQNRAALVAQRVVPSILPQGFDDVIVVGDWPRDDLVHPSVRYFCVEPLTRTTTDALIKRDVGTLSTSADVLVYLCDDHALAPHFLAGLRDVINEEWDVIVPNRRTHTPAGVVVLNNGEGGNYCGGHGGVFRRHVVTRKPWAAYSHERLWDKNSSWQQQLDNARFAFFPRADISIVDLEPHRKPWL